MTESRALIPISGTPRTRRLGRIVIWWRGERYDIDGGPTPRGNLVAVRAPGLIANPHVAVEA